MGLYKWLRRKVGNIHIHSTREAKQTLRKFSAFLAKVNIELKKYGNVSREEVIELMKEVYTNPNFVDHWLEELANDGVKPKTLLNIVNYVKRGFQWTSLHVLHLTTYHYVPLKDHIDIIAKQVKMLQPLIMLFIIYLVFLV